MQKKVVIGFSGGVDSAASAFLLKQKGYQVIGVTLLVQKRGEEANLSIAEKTAREIGISHLICDFSHDFHDLVVVPYLDGIERGETPSPCPLCNENFKFARLMEIAKREGALWIGTGHYAALREEEGVVYLKRWNDSFKDQSYLLYRLAPAVLQRTLFPLGEFQTKSEVRQLASKGRLSVSQRKDSQGLCFAPDGCLDFLQRRFSQKIKKGKFTNKRGEILGEHEGYVYYTIGQRRGLGISAGEPLFVTQIVPEENRVVLGEYRELLRKEIEVKDWIWHGKYAVAPDNFSFFARARSSSRGQLVSKIEKKQESPDRFRILFQEVNPEAAPGQHLVLYDRLTQVVAGGGIITNFGF